MKKNDFFLFASVFILILFGLIILFSLSKGDTPQFSSFKKQLIFFCLGFVVFFLISLIDWRIFYNSSSFFGVIYLFIISLLFLVLIFGKEAYGAKSWFNFGFFNLQPVELTKIALILVLAKYLSSRHLEIWQFKRLFTSGIFALIPIALVLAQPDLGGAIILGLIWFFLVLISGIRLEQIILLFLIFILIVSLSWSFFLKPYQRSRLINFLNPQKDLLGIGYNRNQALIAIGSGGFFGKGLGWGTQTQLRFLPLAKTDFVFASLAEEMGFIGVTILLFVYLTFFYRLSYWANNFGTNFSKLFTIGFTIKLLFETSINISMNLGLLPIIGIALPFLSLGGSHLLANFIGLGIINNMIKHRM